MNDDIQRAYAALRKVPNANVEEVSMLVALWALGELEKANAMADRLAAALQIGREYAAEAVAANKRNYGERLVSRQQLDIDYLAKIDAALAAYRPSLNPPAESC